MKLIIDCDPGNGLPATDVDDGLALALAWAAPEIDLVAITTVSGNVDSETGAGVATALRDLAAVGTSVHQGRQAADVEPWEPWRAALKHRRDDPAAHGLWAGTAPLLTAPRPATEAVDHLVDLLSGPVGEYTIAAIGPLTNLAAAETRSPGLLARCARIAVLGGAFTGPLGVREINFAVDPEAADLVLRSGADVTLVPLDITRRTWLTPAHVAELATARSELVRYLASTAEPWVSWITAARGWPGSNLHDLLAVALLTRPDLVTLERAAVGVELTGTLTRSRPVRLPDEMSGPTPASDGRSPVNLVTDVDVPGFTSYVLDLLLSYRTKRAE